MNKASAPISFSIKARTETGGKKLAASSTRASKILAEAESDNDEKDTVEKGVVEKYKFNINEYFTYFCTGSKQKPKGSCV